MSDTVEILIPKCVLPPIRNSGRERELLAKHTADGKSPEEAAQLAQAEATDYWRFGNCVQWVVDRHRAFNSDGPGIRAGARIIDAVAGAEEDAKSKPLSKADCKALLEALNAPGDSGYIQALTGADGKPINVPARVFLPYLDAVEDALRDA